MQAFKEHNTWPTSLATGRVVFDIGGNKYRLVAAVHYRGKRVYVRFIGIHKDYDRIDAERV